MRAALAFLTPIGGAREPSPSAVPWFPIVGAVVGLAVGGAWWAASEVWPPLLAAVVAIAVDLALTGMLHVDGLADSADGLLPPLEPEQRLAVMRQPDVGAFGVAVVGIALLLRVASLAAIEPEPLLVAALWAVGRGLAGMTLSVGTYARAGGLATVFRARRSIALFLTFHLSLVAALLVDPIAAVAGLVAGALVLWLAQRRLGGYTGDVLGAVIVAVETVGLVGAAA